MRQEQVFRAVRQADPPALEAGSSRLAAKTAAKIAAGRAQRAEGPARRESASADVQ